VIFQSGGNEHGSRSFLFCAIQEPQRWETDHPYRTGPQSQCNAPIFQTPMLPSHQRSELPFSSIWSPFLDIYCTSQSSSPAHWLLTSVREAQELSHNQYHARIVNKIYQEVPSDSSPRLKRGVNKPLNTSRVLISFIDDLQ
jgi:hypothetical protein